MRDQGERVTGTRDSAYDLISVIYHALQAAEAAQTYQHDAQQAGDQALAQLFEASQRDHRDFAERAKQLLGQRLSQSGGR